MDFLTNWRHSAFNSELNLDTFLFLWFWISLLGLIALDVQSDHIVYLFFCDMKSAIITSSITRCGDFGSWNSKKLALNERIWLNQNQNNAYNSACDLFLLEIIRHLQRNNCHLWSIFQRPRWLNQTICEKVCISKLF